MSILSSVIDPMTQALEQAHHASRMDEVPVGAVIMQGGEVIASAHNLVKTTHDPTAHAEILVLRQASQILKTPYLTQCHLYVTLEPCAMCAQAASLARIQRLCFGAYDPKGGAIDHGSRLFSQPTCHHAPESVGGLREKDCEKILRDFFKTLR